jgi:hypothetical protein
MPKTRFLSTYGSEPVCRIDGDVVEHLGAAGDGCPLRRKAEFARAVTLSNSTAPSTVV